MRHVLAFLLLVLLSLFVATTPAHADTVTDCTETALRNAVLAGGTVTFAADCTITLSATLEIVKDVTVDGSGHSVTIRGNDTVRVFYVNSGVTLNVTRLTITGGKASEGGGIYNGGTLTVTNSTFSGNTATFGGGIVNKGGGTLTVTNSTFSDNSAATDGGGIDNREGTLALSYSTFSHNSASHGGGVHNMDNAEVRNSTFSGNSASADGGGIKHYSGTLTVSNSTFAGNSAVNHGGGIYTSYSTTFKNTIVANSPSGKNCFGGFTDESSGNLTTDDTCPAATNGNPQLGPLQDNGGPTQTMALGVLSAAIDAALDTNCAAADQRGIKRPQGAKCDIGAYEVAPSLVVSECVEAELRLAVAAVEPGGTVTFACSGTIPLTSQITIDHDKTIDGSGQSVILSGKSGDQRVRVLYVNPGVTLNLNRLTIADGSADYGGGGIYNAGTLSLTNSTFSGNRSNVQGGGIYNTGGTVTMSNCTFSGNTALFYGGGIMNYDGTLLVNDSTFSGNSVSSIGNSSGGGIFAEGGMLIVSHSTFSENSAGWGGGAIFANPATVSVAVRNCTFSGNSAWYGGAIHNRSTLSVTNGTFSGNRASVQGGGIYNADEYGATTLKNTIVANSSAGGNCGGSIANGGGNLSYSDTSCPGIAGDPKLSPLRDNGGPTLTMALGPGSAAIDAAVDATCAADPVNNLDQRGVRRPIGAHCDIGAVEQERRAYLPVLMR